MLTEKEIEFASQVAGDVESGNYLLYPREEDYRRFLNEYFIAANKVENKLKLTVRENEIFNQVITNINYME